MFLTGVVEGKSDAGGFLLGWVTDLMVGVCVRAGDGDAGRDMLQYNLNVWSTAALHRVQLVLGELWGKYGV